MRKWNLLFLSFCYITFLAGCGYEDDDVVATFQDEEITIFDLRKVSNIADDDIPEVTRNYIFREAVILEAKRHGITVTDTELEEEIAFVLNDYENIGLQDITNHLREQAKKLDISYESYVDTVYREEIRKSRYVVKMMEQLFEVEGQDGHRDIAYFHELERRFNDWYNEILQKYEDDIEYYY